MEVIEALPSLLALSDEWERLVDQVPAMTPFQRPDWLLTWWRHFGGGRLHAMVFRSGNQLVGVIPCFLHPWEGKRQLTLIGSGVSDYLEPAIREEFRDGVLGSLRDHLRAHAAWDVCNWQDLNRPSLLSQMKSNSTWEAEWIDDTPCSEILLAGDFERYWAERPSGLRRNVRRYGDKARQMDTPEFRIAREYDRSLVDELIRLHTLRWHEQGEPGMIAANRSAGFLRELTKCLADKQELMLFSLLYQGDVAAVILSLPYRNVLFSYLSAFDPAYGALGLGKLLLYEAVRYSFNEGYTAWNFLRGSEPYKADWGAQPIQKSRWILRRLNSRDAYGARV